jgi:hypothetical protein
MKDEKDRRIEELELLVEALKARLDSANVSKASNAGGGFKKGQTVPEDELDTQYGNFEIKRDPPRWSGKSYAGCTLSRCSPEFLDTYAGFKDWCGDKDAETGAVTNTGKPKAQFAYRDASRARQWAKRIRENEEQERQDNASPAGGEAKQDDQIPF